MIKFFNHFFIPFIKNTFGPFSIPLFNNFLVIFTIFYSASSVLERSLVIDNKIVWWVDEKTKEYWHKSVGIFVFNSENKALFFKRIIYPFALAIPAGHLNIGENAQTAVGRKLNEETGISLENNPIQLFTEENVIGDKCRRGADHHKWHLYVSKIDNIVINNEGTEPIWLSLENALKNNPVYPVKFFIEKYGNKLFKNLF